MQKKYLPFIVILLLLSCKFENTATQNDNHHQKNHITIMNWNTQTFFDTTVHGTEYSDFKKKNDNWTVTSYKNRVKRLCSVIEATNADIVVLEEIENQAVVFDIINNLKYQGIPQKKYEYSFFYKNDNDVFGNAILSRMALVNPKIHQVHTEISEKQPQLRPIIEISILPKKDIGNFSEKTRQDSLLNAKKKLTLFVSHWKSKSGGEGKTALWRSFQESLLTTAAGASFSSYLVFCGDFNRDLEEFTKNEKNNIIFSNKQQEILLHSPWLNSQEKGSYFYKNQWNKIDHFFLSEAITLEDFYVYKENITKEDGTPLRFNLYNGEGYSDHLPIVATISY